MPYYGVAMAALYAACRTVYDQHTLATFALWRRTTLTLWRDAGYREERYAAIVLTGHRTYDAYQRLSALPMYREMIVTGAWWDYVDPIASNRIGELLRRHPASMKKTMRTWARSEDMWLRRTSIICQLNFKQDTDLTLLYDCIEPSIESREFFLRKAIGWALRQYAREDAREVLRYVKANRARLSGLSKKEALKAQLRAGTLREVP
jgi:3-methyladenine DNA glycosylase AlkD